ncbi:MAG: glycosyltransferase, partial [Elusimicrobiota bacterium]|nr:glycosyltransferase [Elusimicrobiota bacterium]
MIPKISVIVPVYNTPCEDLKKCIESIINQTLKEIEIILVNDGSTNGNLEILKEYARKDKRIVLIDQQNQGVSASRNAGINIAKGQYIGFVDSDDWIEDNYYELLYASAIKENADIA